MAFFDTSALVPLCVNETTSADAGRVWKRLAKRIVWCATIVELESAIARLLREKELDPIEFNKAKKRLERLETDWKIIEHNTRIIELARTFPFKYQLKAADSLQLAAALVWCKEFPKNKDFVSGDGKLLKAAEAAGFTIHDLS